MVLRLSPKHFSFCYNLSIANGNYTLPDHTALKNFCLLIKKLYLFCSKSWSQKSDCLKFQDTFTIKF